MFILLLVGGFKHFLFSILYIYIWDNPSHWLSYFPEGLKPPTRLNYSYIRCQIDTRSSRLDQLENHQSLYILLNASLGWTTLFQKIWFLCGLLFPSDIRAAVRHVYHLEFQWEISRNLKWRYVSTIFLAIFSGDIHLHRPYIGLIYGIGTSNQSDPEDLPLRIRPLDFRGPHSTDFPWLKHVETISQVAKLVWLSMPLLLVKLYKIHWYLVKSHCWWLNPMYISFFLMVK